MKTLPALSFGPETELVSRLPAHSEQRPCAILLFSLGIRRAVP